MNAVLRSAPRVVMDIAKRLHDERPDARILLFGSWAKGGAKRGSDVDFLLVTKVRLPDQERRRLRAAFHDFPVKVDVVFATAEELDNGRQDAHSFLWSVMQTAMEIERR